MQTIDTEILFSCSIFCGVIDLTLFPLIFYFFAGLCHNGAWKLPSGKWLCIVNADITKAHPEGQKYCQVIGFDRLYEPRTLEDSQLTVRLEFCKYIHKNSNGLLFQEGLRLFISFYNFVSRVEWSNFL